MQDEVAFLEAIALEPENDAPRLVYADWLEEHGGDQNRANLIRLQCHLKKGIDFRTGTLVDEKSSFELKVLEKSIISELLRRRTPGESLGLRELTPRIMTIVGADRTRISFSRGFINNLSLYGATKDLIHTQDFEIPQAFLMDGSLNLQGSTISRLPPNLHIRRNLDLSDTPITHLPDDLSVDGNLNLSNTYIRQLPKGLRVRGTLNLTDTLIARYEATAILTMPNLSDTAKITGLESAGFPALADEVRRKAAANSGPDMPPR